MNVLGLIPARGGSKGVPRKNIHPLGGKPLIAWTLETAKSCSLLNRTIVSTDDGEIAEVAKKFGAEVPFLRPAELSRDDTPDFPVFAHAVQWLKDHEKFSADVVVWLRPTAPLRTIEDISAVVKLLADSGADAVRSVCQAEHHPYWMKRLEKDKLLPFSAEADEVKYSRRQLLPPVYRLNGAVDAARCATALKRGTLFGGDVRGYVMPSERSVDMDSETDFDFAELFLQRRQP